MFKNKKIMFLNFFSGIFSPMFKNKKIMFLNFFFMTVTFLNFSSLIPAKLLFLEDCGRTPFVFGSSINIKYRFGIY